MHILFISTHNFATNPRLVKEIDLALENGWQVSVVCCNFNNWSRDNNEKIKQRLLPHIHYYEVAGNRKPLLAWLQSSCWFFMSKILLPILPANVFLLSVRSNKRSWLLLKKLRGIKENIDLVVGHNIGSFYPAWRYAQKRKIPFGIDVEDHHPGETNDATEAGYMRALLKRTLPAAAYTSAASPLMLEETIRITGALKNAFVILNYFPGAEFKKPLPGKEDGLQLVWFSQNIAKGRGLETIIPAIKEQDNILLHLYGNPEPGFVQEWIAGIKNIRLHAALPQEELHQSLQYYDAGLAIEMPSSNQNRDICLTNKLLAYYQAGLYILATDTSAQKDFLSSHSSAGELISFNDLKKTLETLAATRIAIRQSSGTRYTDALAGNWEAESKKLLLTWNSIVH